MLNPQFYRRVVNQADVDGIEMGVIEDGTPFLTGRGLANVCGISAGTLSDWGEIVPVTGDRFRAGKMAKLLMEHGFEGDRFFEKLIYNGQEANAHPDPVCMAFLEYYAFEAGERCTEEAKNNYRILARKSLQQYIYLHTGYKTSENQNIPLLHSSTYIRRLENMRDHEVDDDLWTTFREGAEVLLFVEKELRIPVDRMDLCDGSIGSHWGTYRQRKEWVDEAGSYFHVFRDQRGKQESKAYKMTELPHFRKWLRHSYYPNHLPDYLINKYGKRAILQVYTEINGLTDYILQVTAEKRPSEKQNRLYEEFLAARSALTRRNA